MAIFTPPSVTELFSPRGQGLFKPAGSDREFVFPEMTNLGANPTFTEASFSSKSYEVSLEVKSVIFAKSLELSVTAKSLNKRSVEWLFMAPDGANVLTQTAVPSKPVTFANPEVGDIFDLGALDIAVASVTDGAASAKVYELGTHYLLDSATGRVEILGLPEGADNASVKITYSAPAITPAAKRQAFGVIGGTGKRGQFTFRELGREGPFNWFVTYWDVEIRPDGEIPHLGDDDFADIALKMKVYARAGKPRGEEYGRVVVIPKA